MPTIPITWYAIAALVASNLFTTVMWRMDAHQLQLVELRSEIAEKDAERVIEEQKQITEDTTNAWKLALDTTRNDWSKRLRDANVQPMPAFSGPTGGVDDLTSDQLALAAQCAETTLQLITFQQWVKQQSYVK